MPGSYDGVPELATIPVGPEASSRMAVRLSVKVAGTLAPLGVTVIVYVIGVPTWTVVPSGIEAVLATLYVPANASCAHGAVVWPAGQPGPCTALKRRALPKLLLTMTL